MKPFDKSTLFDLFKYGVLTLVVTVVLGMNWASTVSDSQFRTDRDGSEALVLGKVFADANGVYTGTANLGFVEKKRVTKGSDVLATYLRLDHPNQLIPADVNDPNWVHGLGTFGPVFLLPRAGVARTGYASNELAVGDGISFGDGDGDGDGDARIVTKVELSDQYLQVYYSGAKVEGAKLGLPFPIHVAQKRDFVFDGYRAQYGLQGRVFSWTFRNMGVFSSVARLQLLSAFLCAVVLVLLCREYQLSFSKGFGVVFILCMIGSPWVVAIARNLYWVSSLWFLPALVAMWLYRYHGHVVARHMLYFLFFISIMLKGLAGYEYLSTIVLFAVLVLLVDPFLATSRYRTSETIRIVSALFLLSVAGFIAALLVHASIRADSILAGLRVTFDIDVLKYTQLGNAMGAVTLGTEASLAEVLGGYVFRWETPVLFWLNHRFIFPGLAALALASVLFQYLTKDQSRHRDAALILLALMAPLSWFVLMKGHSSIHVHLNYVLWYFGLIPSLVFVSARGVFLFLRHIRAPRFQSTAASRRFK